MDNIEQIINGIAKKAAEANPPEQGDYYGNDELLYCHKCNTPKQCKISLFFGERVVTCLCKCQADKIKAEEEARKRAEFEIQVQKNRRIAFPESAMQYWSFDNDDGASPQLMTIARNYVDNFKKMLSDGKGLLFYGTVGTGKTYAAASIANAVINQGYPTLVTNFARIANTVQGLYEGKQAYYDSFNKFALLVIDDLSAERKTEYMQEIVFNVIDSRYRAGLPTIITTNLTAEEIKNPADINNRRTFSRVLEMCVPIEVKGVDRRREILKDTYAEYKAILGL